MTQSGGSQEKPVRGPWARLSDHAWFLLVATMFMWGANAPVLKLGTGEISPMTVVVLRWALVGFAVLAFRPPTFASDLRAALRRPLYVGGMAALMTISNAAIFIGAQHTTGINLSILQGVSPVLVMFGAWLWFRTPIGPVRMAGLIISTLGVLMLATQGNVFALGDIKLNVGDSLMLLSVVMYTIYVLALRYRPAMPNYSFYCCIALFSLLVSTPMLGVEMALGMTYLPSWKGLLVLLYVAAFTSMLGQIFFMRAIELVGPGRAALFQNLAPVIGSVLSVMILSEPFAWYHGLALLLVTGGILIAERYGSR